MSKKRYLAYMLLRISVGVMFLFYGIGKFRGGVWAFVAGMEKQFAGKIPSFLVVPFSSALPFLETIVGSLLILGIYNTLALLSAALLLIALTLGTVVLGESDTVAHNILLSLVIFVLLWTADNNVYSLRIRRNARAG